MTRFIRIVSGNLVLKTIALIFAIFLWTVAVLDRTYEVRLEAPVKVVEKGRAERLIIDIDTKVAVVILSGKGKDLFRLRRSGLEFSPVVPEGKYETREVRLNPSDLKLPPNIIVRSIEPEVVEVRLGPARTKKVSVLVPTKGQPPAGMMVYSVTATAGVTLVGPVDELDGYNTVWSETLDLSAIRQGEIRRLRVVPPPGNFSCIPESVGVEVVLEKEAARIFLGLPVQVAAPPTIDVQVVPNEAQIAIAGPARKIDSLNSSDIKVQITLPGFSPGSYQLKADVIVPERFRVVKIEPQLFDVTVR
ncbi:MAG: CdaR family protein [bacterium]